MGMNAKTSEGSGDRYINVRCKCGHSEQIISAGSPSGIESTLRYYSKNRICRLCFQRTKFHEAARSQMLNEQQGLPELAGSIKQIAWAEGIRHEIISAISARLGREDRLAPPDLPFENNEYLAWISSQTNAAWWIVNRDNLRHNLKR